jgi:hypothetical protein
LTRERGVRRIGKQVVCRFREMKLLGCFAAKNISVAVLDADDLVVRGVHDEKRFSQRRDVPRQLLATHVVDELPADLERVLSNALVRSSVALNFSRVQRTTRASTRGWPSECPISTGRLEVSALVVRRRNEVC